VRKTVCNRFSGPANPPTKALGVRTGQIRRGQAEKLHRTLQPTVGFLHRLRRRKLNVGFLSDDPLFVRVCRAYDALHRLFIDLQWSGNMATHKARRSVRRFLSPASLLLALMLFPLPWVSIECPHRSRQAPITTFLTRRGIPDEMADRLVPWEQDAGVLFTQSGLEAALGTCTARESENETEAVKNDLAELRSQLRWSPLMALFPFVVTIGIIAGFCPSGKRLLILSTLTGLSLLSFQTLCGFSVVRAFGESCRRDAEARPGAAKLDPAALTHHTAWLMLTFFALIAATLLSAVDSYLARRISDNSKQKYKNSGKPLSQPVMLTPDPARLARESF
jgi:hypothetical protein